MSSLILPAGSQEPNRSLASLLSQQQHVRTPSADSLPSQPTFVHGNSEAEDALESHEVVELQAFIERKAWIEEKIQFLESLPSIDIFAGVEQLSISSGPIAGLTTRHQLDEWIAEHERIEKETEIFDSGDLKKLKKLTKAATQRNLSSEDTDLIELTLTTLLALDKLFHLLRNRSEQLELLSLRLTWEESRLEAYSARTKIFKDLHVFLTSRAKWTPDLYAADVAHRDHSDTIVISGSPNSFDDLSRPVRMQLADELSREAAQFSNRIATLRHGPLSSAAKTLDKLIDDSRIPLPDAIMDEQDSLEENCDKAVASVGKFVMAVVMQWKRADEFYVETRKDRLSIRVLSDDIKNASACQPMRQLEADFTSRFVNLTKRLFSRPNPSSPVTTFPLPTHPLFPDQVQSSTTLVNILSSELLNAQEELSRVDAALKSYCAYCDEVEAVEMLEAEILELQKRLVHLRDRFRYGFKLADGDGSPPNLSDASCIEPLKSSAFIAMLPSLVEEALQAELAATELLNRARLEAARLDRPSIDGSFRAAFLEAIGALDTSLRDVTDIRNTISEDISRLRSIRRIWSTMDDIMKALDLLANVLRSAIMLSSWKQQVGGNSAPLTPESPKKMLPADGPVYPDTAQEELDAIQQRFERDVVSTFMELSHTLSQIVNGLLNSKKLSVRGRISDTQLMILTWEDVKLQTSAMEKVREEVHALENCIEDILSQYEELTKAMLVPLERCLIIDVDDISGNSYSIEIEDKERTLATAVNSISDRVMSLAESLSTRVPFVSRRPSRVAGIPHGSQLLSALDNQTLPEGISFDPAALDLIVRNDCNAYASRLNGGIASLVQKKTLIEFYHAADCSRQGLSHAQKELRAMESQLDEKSLAFDELADDVPDDPADHLFQLSSLDESLETMQSIDRPRIGKLITVCHEQVSRMMASAKASEDSCRSMCSKQLSLLDGLDLHLQRLSYKLSMLRTSVSKAMIMKEAAKPDDEQAMVQTVHRVLENPSVDFKHKEDCGSTGGPNEHKQNTFQLIVRREREQDSLSTRASSSPDYSDSKSEAIQLLSRIQSLRRRLESLGLDSLVHSPLASKHHSMGASLPELEIANVILQEFACIDTEVDALARSASTPDVDEELRSLTLVVDSSRDLARRAQQLARFQSSVAFCDKAFSEFLDYIDESSVDCSAAVSHGLPGILEERLSGRTSQTKSVYEDMVENSRPVMGDSRVVFEYGRLKQTWEELFEMAIDRINDRLSRPDSALALTSGRTSSASLNNTRSYSKHDSYTKISREGRGNIVPTQRRVVSSSFAESSRPAAEDLRRKRVPSKSSYQPPVSLRSASGTVPSPFSSSTLYSSTYSSRQRTASVSSAISLNSANNAPAPAGRRRRMSGTPAETRQTDTPITSLNSRGTWARAPRQSFGSFSRASTPDKLVQRRPKKYVANPKNKLDMAVGDVVNNLPVNIDIAAADTVKDKSTSGKYFIGYGEDSKLCFCRILRSQTVMVRVGGGWVELSRFIKNHFAHLFALEATPPRPGSRERWITSKTLQSTTTDDNAALMSPATSESLSLSLPSFAFSTPEGTQVSGLQTSPLTAMRFMRRAGVDASDLSLSPVVLSSNAPVPPAGTAVRPTSAANHVSKATVWRP